MNSKKEPNAKAKRAAAKREALESVDSIEAHHYRCAEIISVSTNEGSDGDVIMYVPAFACKEKEETGRVPLFLQAVAIKDGFVPTLSLDQVGFTTDEVVIKKVMARGGATFVTLTKGDKTYTGVAWCSAVDNFNRKIGFKIALGRALKKMMGAQ